MENRNKKSLDLVSVRWSNGTDLYFVKKAWKTVWQTWQTVLQQWEHSLMPLA